ncbi:MAG: S8 family serine peptidase [Chthonomonadaceae bacterium]|nr:S8 family serine peptidase [Chthonomonadaceae bacterium]
MTLVHLALSVDLQSPVSIQGTLCHPQRLLIKSDGPIDARVELLGGRVIAHFPQIGWSTVEVPALQLLQVRAQLARLPQVRRVELDRAASLAYTPNDPFWSTQWHMRTIKADLAWDVSKGQSSTIVALIDTGLRVDHEDIASQLWTNSGEVPGNNLDDDNNGYVDDVHGFDFAYNTSSLVDTLGHGTGCAGILGATQDNNLGVTGVCPRLQIMALKACNDSGYLYDSYLVPAYIYGAEHGAKVYSMSYFSDRVSPAEKDAMDFAVAHDVLPIAAAGNSSSVIPYYPAAYDNVMSVAATDGANQRSWFSNYGGWVDVAAPGQDLVTTSADGTYRGFGGTSGACPHVAGAAALIRGAVPLASAQQIRVALEDTATTLDQPPFGVFSNYGLINVQAALNAAMTVPEPQKSVLVRYVSVLGQSLATNAIDPGKFVTSRIFGRGFLGMANPVVKIGQTVAPVLAIGRDYIDYKHTYRQAGAVTLWDGTNLVQTVQNPIVPRSCRPLNEVSSPTSAVYGGFFEALMDDNSTVNGVPDGNGDIIVHGTFRQVVNNINTQLRVKSSYSMAGGTEYVQLYDWQSASYPYGNWVTIAQRPVSTSPQVTTVNVPDISRFIDVTGVCYVQVYVQGVPSGQELRIDSARLQDSR